MIQFKTLPEEILTPINHLVGYVYFGDNIYAGQLEFQASADAAYTDDITGNSVAISMEATANDQLQKPLYVSVQTISAGKIGIHEYKFKTKPNTMHSFELTSG